MKLSNVVVGAVYKAKVSGQIVPVKVNYDIERGGRKKFVCTNLNTNRQITCSAARLRKFDANVTTRSASLDPREDNRSFKEKYGRCEDAPCCGCCGSLQHSHDEGDY
jgi:hypothetical protein